jgi:hypothetical protein
MISRGGELLGGTTLFCPLPILFRCGHGAVIMDWMCPPPAPRGLEVEGDDLYC